MFGGVLSSVGGSLGPLLGYIGQEETNDTNVMLNRENRFFQAEMANTQYQRAVSDMRAAGLNPALMFKNAAPSAVPSTNPATVQSELGSAVTSAQQVGSLFAGLEKIAAETGLIEAQKKNVEAQTITEIAKPESVKAMTALYGANTAKAVAETVTESFRPAQVRAQTATEAVRPGEVISSMLHHDASAAAVRERGYKDRVDAQLKETFGSGYLGREAGSIASMARAVEDAVRRALGR